MIPKDIQEWIFPEIADGTEDAAILHHDCGIDVQFTVELDDESYVITTDRLRSWQTTLDQLATIAGENCFSYNTLPADPEGVYYNDDGNTFAILLAPSTFIEHNEVDGQPLLLVISDEDCILTGSHSKAGKKLLRNYLPKALANEILTIDAKWEKWTIYKPD